LCTSLPSSIRATSPAHLILLDFITRTILGEEYREILAWANTRKLWNFIVLVFLEESQILKCRAYQIYLVAENCWFICLSGKMIGSLQ
jgi:hypothetical protein